MGVYAIDTSVASISAALTTSLLYLLARTGVAADKASVNSFCLSTASSIVDVLWYVLMYVLQRASLFVLTLI